MAINLTLFWGRDDENFYHPPFLFDIVEVHAFMLLKFFDSIYLYIYVYDPFRQDFIVVGG